ncbi:putative DNA helicase MCM9 isoform X4 [Cucumis melo var. makuwa]|nr:putative DNA helicase MCM9 isoform X4 [Cucumis melo var. makuwa]
MDDDPPLARLLFSRPTDYLRIFDDAAVWAHMIILGDSKGSMNGVKKDFIHVRINVTGSPLEFPETFPSIGSVRVKHHGVLLTLKGTVIRSGAIKMYEGERWYICRKCKHK